MSPFLAHQILPITLPQYLAKYAPLFERRKAILLGNAEPTPEEVAAGEAVSEKDDPEAAAEAKAEREAAEKNLSEEDKAIKGKCLDATRVFWSPRQSRIRAY